MPISPPPPIQPSPDMAPMPRPPWNRRKALLYAVATVMFALGLTLLFNCPPNAWPDMPLTLIHVGVAIGVLLLLASAFVSVAAMSKGSTAGTAEHIWSYWLRLSSPHGLRYLGLATVILLLVVALLSKSPPQ